MDMKKCRLCLQDDEQQKYRSLFEIFESTEKLCDKITYLTKIEIYPNDGLPALICNKCIKRMKHCLEFISLCRQSDTILRNAKVESDDELYIDVSDENEPGDTENNKEIEFNKDTEKVKDTIIIKHTKHQCFTCGKVMSSRFRLKTHIVTHSGERPFSCSQCGKKFSLAQTLNVHMRIHTGEKPFRCSTCGEDFAHSSGLSAHERKHTGQLPYSCKLCPRKFRTIGHLQYHVRRHTGQKNFECDSCGRAFITRNDLKNHSITHSVTKPLVCNVCGLRLSRTSNLKRHIKLVHNGTNITNNLNSKQTVTLLPK